MGSLVIEFDANEEEDWLFHCHNQYHMKTGMNRVVSYEETSLFTPEMDELIRPSTRWFDINNFHVMSSFVDYELSFFDERHEYGLEVDTDFAGSYEVHGLYTYYFSRFVSAFAGFESRMHHHDNTHDIGIAGVNVTLPLLIESEWRLNDHGRFRLELQSEIPLTRNFGLDWRWNTDNEYRYGINYRLNNRWSLTVHTDTEYGDGVGIKFFY
jgi:multicopper oxidase